MAVSLLYAPLSPQPVVAHAAQGAHKIYAEDSNAHHLQAVHQGGFFVLRKEAGQTVCHDATLDETLAFKQRDANLPLHVINPTAQIQTQGADGLTITLRGTAQLEANQPAKAAFTRAAATWQAIIKSPITLIIDVDFGTTRFGKAYDKDVLGATDSQEVEGPTVYPSVRSRLLSSAGTANETALYNALPQGSVPTTIGNTTEVDGPASVFRALGLLSANADPANETDLGDPPSIGFNSAFDYDFDPSDGIDAAKVDFEGVALHEIGHVLGFSSAVGVKELLPSATVGVTTWDLFRFRPGVTTNTFGTMQRVISSGGNQIFFNGTTEIPLATGRPDGTGGDGDQASHWKDDATTGNYIGLMDPSARDGQRLTITQNDRDALELFGHALTAAPPSTGDTTALTSGTAQTGSLSAPNPSSCVLGSLQYSIAVPAGATQLKIDLNGSQDVDLFVRSSQRVSLSGGVVASDFSSEGDTGIESITITTASTKPLQAGTYFIAIGNCGPGASNFTITATVTGGTPAESTPVVNSVTARLDGDTLTLRGSASDGEGDITQAMVKILDANGATLAQTAQFSITVGTTASVNFQFTVNGLRDASTLAGTRAAVMLIDALGHQSAAVNADFSMADSGGINLRSATFDPGGVMILKTTGLSAPADLEVNGVIVTPPLRVKVKSEAKAKVGGTASDFGLRSGANRIRVRINGVFSNLNILTN
ncbi:MAG: pre-peptidase C-terminal domain-containing protein [Acidobacteria bacterium]|nr:pre-peptidase C-terminal domain-containing protein [Acidobacteriota bacterium]